MKSTSFNKFDKKNDFLSKWKLVKEPLKAIAEVHEFGNQKYGKYSWLNADASTFATYESNLGSLLNHFLLYKTKQFYDHETKLSHLAHALCRCQMALTKLYRNINPNIFDSSTDRTDTKIRERFKFIFKSDQIMPETIISLMKWNLKQNKLSVEELEDLIWCSLLDIVDPNCEIYLSNNEDVWNNIYLIDIIFWCFCLLYNKTLKDIPLKFEE